MNKISWPEERPFAVCLTHDVDRVKKTYQYITHFIKEQRPYHLYSFFLKNPYWTFDTIMDIEKKYNVRSTFFFLNETKSFNILKPKEYALTLGRYSFDRPEITKIIRRLDKGGWEIALHGSYESYQNQKLLLDEKKALERVLKKEVVGIRQHYLNLKKPETWKIQKQAGFKYDASFGYTKKIGCRDEKFMPYFPLKNNFLEIPLTIMDSPLFDRDMNLKAAGNACIKQIDNTEKRNALISILWHTDRFNDKERPGQMRIYEQIIKECRKRGAWITNCREIWRHATQNI